MTPNPETKLLACPFCGEQPEYQPQAKSLAHPQYGWPHTLVHNCKIAGHICFRTDNLKIDDTKEALFAAWNTRTTPQPPVEVKDLEKVAETLLDAAIHSPYVCSINGQFRDDALMLVKSALTESTAPLLRKNEELEKVCVEWGNSYKLLQNDSQTLQSQIAVKDEALICIRADEQIGSYKYKIADKALTTDGSELGERLKQAELKVESAIGILMKHGFTNAAVEIIEHTPKIAEKFKQLEQLSTSLDLLVKAKYFIATGHGTRRYNDCEVCKTLTLIETFLKENDRQ